MTNLRKQLMRREYGNNKLVVQVQVQQRRDIDPFSRMLYEVFFDRRPESIYLLLRPVD